MDRQSYSIGKNWRGVLLCTLLLVIIFSCVLAENNVAYANHPDNKIVGQSPVKELNSWFGFNFKIDTFDYILTPNGIQIGQVNITRNGGKSFTELDIAQYSFQIGNYNQYLGELNITSGDTIYIPALYLGVEPMKSCALKMAIRPKFTSNSADILEVFWGIAPPANPIIILDNLEQTTITMTVDLKGNTSQPGRLERYSEATDSWIKIADIGYIYPLTFKDTGLQANTTYKYRTVHSHNGVTSYNWQGGNFYAEFTTSSDPAVVAAQKAENAAQLAREAAEQTLQYSLDAKQSADSALQQINNPTYGLENIYNKIQTVENKVADIQFPPTVEKLIGINNTTATKGNSVLVELVVDNANICRYKVNDGAYGDWENIEAVDYISVELGSTPGIKNIMMQFARGVQDEGGNYIVTSPLKSKGLMIFKL